jgi:hypothetical protein
MSEMVERVAKAIEATMFAPHELPITGELHEQYLETASAAIAEVRKYLDDYYTDDWLDVLDEALK